MIYEDQFHEFDSTAGADPGYSSSSFFFFGGAEKIMHAHPHHKREAQSPLWQGSMQGLLKGTGSSQVFDACRAIWALF